MVLGLKKTAAISTEKKEVYVYIFRFKKSLSWAISEASAYNTYLWDCGVNKNFRK